MSKRLASKGSDVMTVKKALRFEQVSLSQGGDAILGRIDDAFPKGKISTLVGPSGAGKTSVFKLCNGLMSPTRGDIYFNDKLIESYEPVELRRRIGLALQDATMISGTVRENLALPLTLQEKNLSDETAERYMHLVGLEPGLLTRDARRLSGGQRQKLSIARTLINQPEVLLLDEITSSLDRMSRQDIEQLILKINQNYGTTIIWITHSISQARTIGDYTWVMIDGRVVESGTSQLLSHPTNKDVQRFIKGEVE